MVKFRGLGKKDAFLGGSRVNVKECCQDTPGDWGCRTTQNDKDRDLARILHAKKFTGENLLYRRRIWEKGTTSLEAKDLSRGEGGGVVG